MLTLYDKSDTVSKKFGAKPIKDIEGWFESHISEIVIDDTVKRIMYHLDGAEFIGHRIAKKRDGHITNIAYLSQGAKAVICVYTFPKIIFDFSKVAKSDNKAMTCVLTLHRGRVTAWIEERSAPQGYKKGAPETLNRVRVVTWAGTRICQSIDEAYQYFTWCDYYEPDSINSNENYYIFCGIRHGAKNWFGSPLDKRKLSNYKELLEKTGIQSWQKDLEENGITIWYETPFEKYGIATFDDFVVAAMDRVAPICYDGYRYGAVKYPGYEEGVGGYVMAWDEPDGKAEYEKRKKRMGYHKIDFGKLERKYKKLVTKRIKGRA